MAVNFPNSPANGATVSVGNKTLEYNSTTGTWQIQASNIGAFSVSDTAPSSPVNGDLWFNSASLNLYAYYADVDSSQWLQVGTDAEEAQQLSATSSDTAPTSPNAGDMWFDTSELNLYIYYNDGNTSQWVQMNSENTDGISDVSDLTDTTNLLFDGQYSSLTGAPTSSTAGALGTLTKTFVQNEEAEITLSETISPVPNVSVFKEVPQGGLSSKGNWDVNANATNYEFFDEKPISYASTTLTPSATGDGTFDSNNPISRRHIPASTAATTYTTYGAGFSGGMFGLGLYDWGGALLSDDGTKFWMVAKNKGTNSDEAHIYAWTLSTPFRVDTAAAVGSTAIKVITEMSNITALLFNNDGTKIVCANGSNFYQFDLSTAYDLSTMGSGTESNWRIDLQRDPLYIDWSGSGDKLIVTEYWFSGGYSTRVRVFDLNTPYDITAMANLPVGTTTSFDTNNPYYSIYSANIYQKGWKISQDGLKFYAIDAVNGKTLTKELPSAWVMKTGTITTGDQGGLGDGNNWTTVTEDDYDLITGNYYNPTWTQNGSAIILFNSSVAPNYLDIIPLPALHVFPSTDVGKKVVGNSGSAIITATSGTYQSVTAFADTSTISSWQLFGAQGKADGSGIELTGFVSGYDIANASYDNVSFSLQAQDSASAPQNTYTGPKSLRFNSEGTKMYFVAGNSLDHIFEYDLSTAWDLSSASYNNSNLVVTSQTTSPTGIDFSSDGTKLFLIDDDQDKIWKYNLSTAWDLSSASYSNNQTPGDILRNLDSDPGGLVINSDGTRILWLGSSNERVYQMTLSTAYDLSTASMDTKLNGTTAYLDVSSHGTAIDDINISSDGEKLFLVNGYGNVGVYQYDLANPYEINDGTTNLNQGTTTYNNIHFSMTQDGRPSSVAFDALGTKMYGVGVDNDTVYQYSTGSNSQPYSQYSPALTNSSNGQINSSSWVDLDSMVADETKNDGDVFYAVSTDDRTSWGVIKDGDGVRKIARNNSGTWQYNNHAGITIGYDFSNPTAGATSTFTAPDWHVLAFNTDGTKLIALDGGYLKLKSYNLSSAWDISTISSSADAESTISTADWIGATISADGTKLIGYVNSNAYVYEYTMSTPFDVTTLTADGNTNSLGGASTSNAFNWFIKPGTYNTVYAVINRHLYKYTFTGGSIITGTVTRDANFLDLDPANQKSYINNSQLQFKPDGTEFYIGQGTDSIIEKWTLSTAWDITTATKSSETVASVDARSIWLKPNGEKIYYIDQSDSNKIKEINIGGLGYGTSETWVNSTNNNEHATLQQALTSQALNRMNKAQLDAVTDPNHYVLGDTLDLMIAPYAASGTSPISDGVTIGYQADALIKQAINGTDYEAEFPATNKVKIKSLASQNLKIRII